MNGRQPELERVPLTEAEKEHLAPIADRFEQAQRAFAEAQRDVAAVVKLYKAQHKAELTDGPEWNLDRDAFVRQIPPPSPALPPEPEAHLNGDDKGEDMEKQLADMMER